jgi:hypothetical protein
MIIMKIKARFIGGASVGKVVRAKMGFHGRST